MVTPSFVNAKMLVHLEHMSALTFGLVVTPADGAALAHPLKTPVHTPQLAYVNTLAMRLITASGAATRVPGNVSQHGHTVWLMPTT